ncbi:MAG: rod shape-determining protein MreC [Gammaproteobacteria bacterium HGW-Gammaproteobacteria-8]|nr:MAG: rod shape-determining protein MreC [Gammaproteobacteria bacterium HGW-Gammaproteobacteria-8]
MSGAGSMPGIAGTARLMFYSLLAVSLMALDYRGQYLDRFRTIATGLTEPLLLAVDLPAAGVEHLAGLLQQRSTAQQRIQALEQDLARAQAELGLLNDLFEENRQLRVLLETTERVRTRHISAEIGAVDLNPFAHRLMLRRGGRDGVQTGMPAVDAFGVLGQVDHVGFLSSRIVLITDPDHALPVQILPSGERTIAYGSGAPDRLRLKDLPMNTAIEAGHLVVTSGIGGRFPPGLPVAVIEAVSRDPGQLFAQAIALPLAEMGRNRVVLLLEAEPSDPEVSDRSDAEPESGEATETGIDSLPVEAAASDDIGDDAQ